MNGLRALELLNETRTNQVVVADMSANYEWPHITRRPELDVPITRCMSKASSFGLGIALGEPKRQVWVFDGDGSLLMSLGSLVTIAGKSPKNLVHFVFVNGTYDISGGQPIPNAKNTKFHELARAAGYKQGYEFRDFDLFKKALPGILKETGPVFVSLDVDPKFSTRPLVGRTTCDAIRDLRRALDNS